MSEVRYTVREEYPSGHEMSWHYYGPGTEAELREVLEPRVSDPGMLDDLFATGELDDLDSRYWAEPVRDWVIAVTWSEPQDGVAVYGPYESDEMARNAWADHVQHDFMNVDEVPEDVDAQFVQIHGS